MLSCQRPPRRKREPIRTLSDGKQICDCTTAEGLREYKARTVEMWLRQKSLCAICGQWINLNVVQFDHQTPRGGGNQDDRIEVDGHWQNAALCENCNNAKGSKRYHWIEGKYTPVTKSKAA